MAYERYYLILYHFLCSYVLVVFFFRFVISYSFLQMEKKWKQIHMLMKSLCIVRLFYILSTKSLLYSLMMTVCLPQPLAKGSALLFNHTQQLVRLTISKIKVTEMKQNFNTAELRVREWWNFIFDVIVVVFLTANRSWLKFV